MPTQSTDYTYLSAINSSIPATVGMLLLQDRGHSFWSRASSQPAHPGRFRSQDRYLPNGTTDTTNGGWWELARDQQITPFMFGAVGDGGATNDTVALQNFFDFCDLARVRQANWEGLFGVGASLYLGGTTQSTAHSLQEQARFSGEMTLLVKNNIAGAVVYNRTRANAVFDRLNIHPYQDPGLNYANKLFDFGILFDSGSQQQTWNNIVVSYARIWGVFIQTYGNLQVVDRNNQNEIDAKRARDNTFSNNILNSFFYGCGSGSEFWPEKEPAPRTANFNSSGFSVYSRDDTWGSVGQSTTLSVTTMPPAIINGDTLGTGYETPIFARVNDEYYRIVSMDFTNKRVSLFPVVPGGFFNGTIYYVYGGGLGSVGGDAGLTTVKGTANACATGYWNGAQYPGYFDVTVQHSVWGYTVGAHTAGVAIGGAGRVYFEANDNDFLWNASTGANGEHSILAQTALNPRKIRWWTARLSNGTLALGLRPQGLQINYRGRWLHTTADANDPGTDNYYLGYARFHNPPAITSLRGHAGFDIQIEEFSIDHVPPATNATFRDKFGFRAQYFLCVGTSNANGAPSGNVTVKRVRNKQGTAYGTLNGGTVDVTLSGPFSGPVLVCVEQSASGSDNYHAYVVAGREGSGTLGDNSVTNLKLADMAQNTIKGRIATGTGDPEDLSGPSVVAMLPNFGASNRGVVPASGGGTGNFLRADGSWAAPPSGSSSGSFSDTVTITTENPALVINSGHIKLTMRSGGATRGYIDCNATNSLEFKNSGGDLAFSVSQDGQNVRMPLHNATTGAAANMVMDNNDGNRILRSTSSRRYKQDIQPLADERADKLLEAPTITYRSKSENDDPGRVHWGLVAEDLHDLGLTELVTYNAEGEPDAVQYERVVVGLLHIVKAMAARLESLEQAIGAD